MKTLLGSLLVIALVSGVSLQAGEKAAKPEAAKTKASCSDCCSSAKAKTAAQATAKGGQLVKR